jgi:ribosomal protein S18 acetylase RimI-like enzyme
MLHNLPADRRTSWLRWLSGIEILYQHVGWHPVSYWAGRPVSLCLEKTNGALAASLLVCPDQLGVAWLQLFAAEVNPGARSAWERLWPSAMEALRPLGVDRVWVMTTQSWFAALLLASGFRISGHVVALMYCVGARPEGDASAEHILPVREADLAEIESLDQAAFPVPWQLDTPAVRETRLRSALATLYRVDGRVLGYQMAVPTAQGVHLARLAVHPDHRRRGIGRALVTHLLGYFSQQGAPRVTVNTQDDNAASLRLYRGLGFQPTGDSYPVYCFTLPPDGMPAAEPGA